MLNIYDHESKAIVAEIHHVQEKWLGKPFTAENIHVMASEIQGRLEDLGFTSIVDVTPLYEFQPVQVAITGRTSTVGEFDHEKKAHEVKQSRAEGGV